MIKFFDEKGTLSTAVKLTLALLLIASMLLVAFNYSHYAKIYHKLEDDGYFIHGKMKCTCRPAIANAEDYNNPNFTSINLSQGAFVFGG